MRARLILILAISAIAFPKSHAQLNRYLIRFSDKANNPYSLSNPSQFLSARAIERRLRYSISIDSTDLPVTPAYLDSIRLSGNIAVLNVSKWLNQVAIQTTDSAALDKISRFAFVASSTPIAGRQAAPSEKFPESVDIPFMPSGARTESYYSYGRSGGQVNLHRGSFLHELGFRGQGMQISVLDAGFFRYQALPTFDSIRTNGQILGTWDFVKNEESVGEDNSHGMQCLSTMAANMPGIFVGSAPAASYYLFRTEDVNSEYPIEEHFWAVGAEKADSLGADVISSSLGYTAFSDPAFNYSYSDMNGQTTMIAKAAGRAAAKGILVVTSAGNEGTYPWHYIVTPADAYNVMSVGAVDSAGNVANFSSYGPSFDGRIRPAFTSVGWFAVVASASSGLPAFSSGTSFSCPNLAGLSTCLWQGFPEMTAAELQQVMRQSATRADDPDDRVGYGIPDMKKAFVICLRQTFSAEPIQAVDCKLNFSFRIRCSDNMNVMLERKFREENSYTVIRSAAGPTRFSDTGFQWSDDLTGRPAGTVTYRYRIDINNDSTVYLDSVPYQISSTCEVNGNTALVYQDPDVPDRIFVRLSTENAGTVKMELFDALGRLLRSEQSVHTGGIRTLYVPLNGLPGGIYMLRVIMDKQKLAIKKFFRP